MRWVSEMFAFLRAGEERGGGKAVTAPRRRDARAHWEGTCQIRRMLSVVVSEWSPCFLIAEYRRLSALIGQMMRYPVWLQWIAADLLRCCDAILAVPSDAVQYRGCFDLRKANLSSLRMLFDYTIIEYKHVPRPRSLDPWRWLHDHDVGSTYLRRWCGRRCFGSRAKTWATWRGREEQRRVRHEQRHGCTTVIGVPVVGA
jgi:hypothetical protein